VYQFKEVKMPRFLIMIALLMIPGIALAQSNNSTIQGYTFAAPGATSGGVTTLHVGGGGEGFVYKGLGVGAEIGYMGFTERFGNGFGVFSPDVSYHFNRSGKVNPFVSGGYSLAFRNGVSHGGNFGGGINYWFSERAAVRFEFRDHIFSSDSPHFYQARIGLTFR
jgi:hypothetical protein